MALAGKPAPGHVEVPRPQSRGAGPPEPREPAAERVPALLERDREHGPRPVGDAAGERARRDPDDDGDGRRSARRTRSTSAGRSRSRATPATRSSPSRPSRSSSTTRLTTTGTPPTSRGSRSGRAARPATWSVGTRSRSASASSTSTTSTATRRRARRCSGTATRATRASVGLGRPVPPGDRRSAGRPDRAAERERLLPRLDDEPDRRLPRAEQDEQHRVGEVHPVDGVEWEPQGHGHGALVRARAPECAASSRPTADPDVSRPGGCRPAATVLL